MIFLSHILAEVEGNEGERKVVVKESTEGRMRKSVRQTGSVLIWGGGQGKAEGNQSLDHSVNFPLQLPERGKAGVEACATDLCV